MANQTFKVAGITVHGDVIKVRFTDDMVRRIKQFTKGGASRVDFVDLPSEMTKAEALVYLQGHSSFQSAADQATLADARAEREKEARKGEVKVRGPRKVKAEKPTLDAIKARGNKGEPKVSVSPEEILAQVQDQVNEALM